tara:strand:+ start:12727 stop:13374 length:648 start_codon:yes stop_codon:yes gene_type:complete
MPAPFNPKNVIVFASTVSPIFITFFLIFDGALNGNVKFIVYLVGIFLAIMIGILLRGGGSMNLQGQSFAEKTQELDNYVKKCMTFDGPFNASYSMRQGPSSHAVFHSFTILYMLQGILANPNDVGWPFVLSLVIIGAIDLFVRHNNKCNTIPDVIKGLALGIFISILYWQVIYNSSFPGPEYLYFTKENNMKKCKLSKTKFVCKRGDNKEIIINK